MSDRKSDERGSEQSGAAQAFGFPAASTSAAEELPSMRSVAIKRGPSLILPPGPIGLQKPSRFGLTKPSLETLSSQVVKQEWSATTPSSTWEVSPEDMDMVPIDFPLERTHRYIHNVGASLVASRIAEVLRAHSVESEFGEKANAKCKTSDMVSFRIRMYAGGEHGEPVVVEVQRRNGPASSFMKTCRALLAAAEGKPEPQRTPHPFVTKPVMHMKCLESVMSKNIVDAAQEALKGVMEMLHSNKFDQHVLALENLVALTDPIKTSTTVALKVAKCVALGDKSHDLRDDVRVLMERDDFAGAEEGPLRHSETLRQLSLQAFSNALELCAKDGSLKDAVDNEGWFCDTFIPNLLDEVRRASRSSCTAYCSTVCLSSLAACSEKARRSLIDNGAYDVLREAEKFGSSRHELMADEAKRCMEYLHVAATAT